MIKKLLKSSLFLLVLFSILGFTVPTAEFSDDANTILLIDMDGTDGSTTLSDLSATVNKGAATFYNECQLDTAQYQFATASLLSDGSGDWISFADNDDFVTGDTDFTYEFWLRLSAQSGVDSLCGQRAGGASFNLIYGNWDATNYSLDWYCYSAGQKGHYAITSSGITTATWYHIAIIRNGATAELWIDGAQKTFTEVAAITTQPNIAAVFQIMDYGNSTSEGTAGWMDELRFSRVNRYPATSRRIFIITKQIEKRWRNFTWSIKEMLGIIPPMGYIRS